MAAEIAAAVDARGLLVVGSSQPVRDLDLMASPIPPGERRLVLGNRGLAGIDGTVSTAIGAALGRPSSRALAYLGDLTFLHDANGLVIGPAEPVPDLTIVVANDDGGAIFATLEQGAPTVRRVVRARLRYAARRGPACPVSATGTAYERADGIDDLRALLAVAGAGTESGSSRCRSTARAAGRSRLRWRRWWGNGENDQAPGLAGSGRVGYGHDRHVQHVRGVARVLASRRPRGDG